MFRTTSKALLLIAALFLLVTGPALAGQSTNASTGLTVEGGPLAIHGYDPVAFFKNGEPQRGSASFAAKHEGAVYRFVSQENLDAFTKDPAKYAPQYGGFCAFGVALGKKFDGDPEVFKIVDGKLYFNLSTDIQATWEEDLEGNLTKADKNWRTIRDKAVGDL
jgi:YHS domain-containing protein